MNNGVGDWIACAALVDGRYPCSGDLAPNRQGHRRHPGSSVPQPMRGDQVRMGDPAGHVHAVLAAYLLDGHHP
eukprot:7268885-Pyramimonas_sp.AAC.1